MLGEIICLIAMMGCLKSILKQLASFFLSYVACLCLCSVSLFLDFLLAASFFDVKYRFTAAMEKQEKKTYKY